MGTIEFQGSGSRIEEVEKADRLVLDLDPDEGLDFKTRRDAMDTLPPVTMGKVFSPMLSSVLRNLNAAAFAAS